MQLQENRSQNHEIQMVAVESYIAKEVEKVTRRGKQEKVSVAYDIPAGELNCQHADSHPKMFSLVSLSLK